MAADSRTGTHPRSTHLVEGELSGEDGGRGRSGAGQKGDSFSSSYSDKERGAWLVGEDEGGEGTAEQVEEQAANQAARGTAVVGDGGRWRRQFPGGDEGED
jgi:hypothetical protein